MSGLIKAVGKIARNTTIATIRGQGRSCDAGPSQPFSRPAPFDDRQGRIRSRSAYAFGWTDKWARVVSLAPGLVNLATQVPFLRAVAELVAGVPPERSMPVFAPGALKRGSAGPDSRT